MEEEETQEKILESLTAEDYNKIILPKDDFFDEEESSSIYENEEKNDKYDNDDNKIDNNQKIEKNKKIPFGNNIYEKYSAYYLSETVLNLNKEERKNVVFIEKINLNDLVRYNRTLPYFGEKLFSILVDFCKKSLNNIIFNPDYIINTISGKDFINKIKSFKENIQFLREQINDNKSYDLIGEVSYDYLTNNINNRKLEQTKKYISFIKLLNTIKNTKEIDEKKNKI